MIWTPVEARLALLELLVRGRLPRRRSQVAAWELLAELSWTRVGSKRDELVVEDQHFERVREMLDRVWPGWVEARAALESLGVPPTPKGWSELQDASRAKRLPALPGRVNRRTALAAVAPHSKSTLTPERLATLGDVELTHDGSVRLRPPSGLVLERGGRSIDAVEVAAVLGEVAISERAFLDGIRIEGRIEALLLVENLGAFQDLVPPEGWLVAHVAGWDTATATHLLRLRAAVPAVHFGDLDPNGVRIYRHLREIRGDLSWLVPEFWGDYFSTHGLRGAWPDDLELADAPALVRRLAGAGLWLEQESIVLDPRLNAHLMA